MGYNSEYFTKSRSVNQGCNISPYIYLLCGEIMAHKFLYNTKIKGITVYDVKMIMSQFADDTALYLEYDRETLVEVVNVLEYVEANTGLRVSYDKTIVYRIGSLQYTDASIYTKKPLQWSDGDIQLLGISISNAAKQRTNDYDLSIAKMQQIAQTWHYRLLTLMGKIMIVNTLMASLFVYKMAVLPDLGKHQIDKIDQIIHKFLWGGKKKGSYKLDILRNPKKHGGLKLVNFETKQASLKLQWVHKIVSTPEMSYIYSYLVPSLGDLIWKVNLKETHVYWLIPEHSFWRNVLIVWCKYHYQDAFCGEEIRNEILWCNSQILIAGKPVYNESCVKAGLLYIDDVLDESGEYLTYDELLTNFPGSIGWLEYNQLKAAIPKTFLMLATNNLFEVNESRFCTADLVGKSKPVKYCYNRILELHAIDKARALFHYFVNNIDQQATYEDFVSTFTRLYKVTKDTRLRWFQYRFITNRIYTNTRLQHMGIDKEALCEYCNELPQTVTHLFWECPIVSEIWQNLKNQGQHRTKLYTSMHA